MYLFGETAKTTFAAAQAAQKSMKKMQKQHDKFAAAQAAQKMTAARATLAD